jgi:ABC-type multidrug transport system fused ATPase/permease subunit
LNESKSNVSIKDLLLRLWHHLSRRRRRQFLLLISLMVGSAFAELVSLGAVLPFLGILTVPDRVLHYSAAASVAKSLGITSARQLVLPLTITFASLAVFAGVFRTLVLWVSTRLAFSSGADLSGEVYRRTLYQPYAVHVARNSSEVISGITSKVHDVVFGVLVPLLTIISSGVLLVAVTTALIVFNPPVALVAIGSFGTTYVVTAWMQRRRLRSNSERIAFEQTRVLKALQEGLGGIRDVLLDGTQLVYSRVYHEADVRLRRAQGDNVFAAQSPRFATESLGMVLIAALAYALSRQTGGIGAMLPMLGALALGAQRLLPALQQSHSAWAAIAGHQASLADAVALLDQSVPPELLQPPPEPLRFRESVRLDGVWFRYAVDGPWIVDNLNLTITKGSRVGLVGITGSGKSTVVDLLMGLLTPSAGAVLVDGEPLAGSRVRAWQRAIAHVPQSIYLSDATFAENIAFGVPSKAIDMDAVRQAARKAQIAEFIESRAESYGVMVGERGIRLSGGQRQRIGIARALYRNASVLVFDEATSALDNSTEQSIMDAVAELDRELTILLIAHRLSTVRSCDVIVELGLGRVVAQGSYEQLLERSPSFRRMAHAAGIN